MLGRRLGLSDADVRRDLEQGRGEAFERTSLYERVLELADQLERRPVPRAVVPNLVLQGPKITRRLTTDWFAHRVEGRYERCLGRLDG